MGVFTNGLVNEVYARENRVGDERDIPRWVLCFIGLNDK